MSPYEFMYPTVYLLHAMAPMQQLRPESDCPPFPFPYLGQALAVEYKQ
jgi:hypothetical protein